jgi:hypothetical protein
VAKAIDEVRMHLAAFVEACAAGHIADVRMLRVHAAVDDGDTHDSSRCHALTPV